MGYHRAGFDVIGVDKDPQKNYPFEFVQDDAIAYLARHGREFDAIHASPPCQAYAGVTAWRGDQTKHPQMVEVTRALLEHIGRPYVIENVPAAPLRRDLVLCGSQLGLRVQRHRVFESNVPLVAPDAQCRHVDLLPFMHKGERAYADAMECYWMSKFEARQAIPPAYTEHIGAQLLDHLAAEVAS